MIAGGFITRAQHLRPRPTRLVTLATASVALMLSTPRLPIATRTASAQAQAPQTPTDPIQTGSPEASAADGTAAAPCSRTAPCKLSVNLPEGDVFPMGVSPTGRAIFLFRAQGVPGTLYSVSLNTPSPVRLSVQSISTVRNVVVSPNGRHVLYTALTGSDPAGPISLFSVPVGGPVAANVRLADNVASFPPVVSPDGLKVTYIPATRDRVNVVSIDDPNTGGRLTAPFATDGFVTPDLRISAESRSLVYRAPQETDTFEVFRAPLTLTPSPNPPTAKLNGALKSGDVGSMAFTPDGRRLLYIAAEDTAGVAELHSVGLGGGGRIRINHPLPPGWFVVPPTDGGELPGRIFQDGSQVVYQILNVQGPQVLSELYSAPIAGPATASVRLDTDLDNVNLRPYLSRAGTTHALYAAVDDDANPRTHWLFTVPKGGPAGASRLLMFPSTEEPVVSLTPGGARALFLWQSAANAPSLLFSTPVGDPRPVRLNGDERPHPPIEVATADQRVVYFAQTSSGDHLFSAPIDGNGARFDLTPAFNGAILGPPMLVRPNGGTRAVYTVIPSGSLHPALYSSYVVPASN
jgi:hypothetical protein